MTNESKKQIEATQRLLNQIRKLVQNSYSGVLNDGSVKKSIADGNDNFSFSGNDSANKSANKLLGAMATQLDSVLLNGIKNEWEFAEKEHWGKLEKTQVKSKIDKTAFDIIREHATQSSRDNIAQSFYNEKRGGFSISERVWNLAGNAKKEIEIIIQNGIKEGKSADEVQKSLKGYLNEPDKLFKRVRNKETGELEWSKAAQKYKPGQGVYRSAYKNAMRLARTELKAANCEAVWNAAQNNPLITGWQIVLSNNHTTLVNGVPLPFKDICDTLQGTYPKTFKFKGWHPQCRCDMLPITINQEERKSLYKSIFDGKRDEWKPEQVNKVPEQFSKWIDDNKSRMTASSRVPYFIRDNFVNGNLADGLKYIGPTKTIKPVKTEQQKADIQARWNTRVTSWKYNDQLQEIKTKYGKESDAIANLISKINNEIQSGTTMSKVDSMMNELNHKLQVKTAWDERVKTINLNSKLDEVILIMDKAKIEYNDVNTLTKELPESAIIERVGGGDLTKGSCSSLAFTYAGNKCGFDVLDFRDGVSRQKFSSSSTIMDIAKKVGGIVVEHTNDFIKATNLLKQVKDGKDYYFTCGAHAAIVRKNATGYEYLELQSATKNGFKALTTMDLKYRFSAKKSHTLYGKKYETKDCVIDIELLKKDRSFRKLLGYINTPENKQKKGKTGTMK